MTVRRFDNTFSDDVRPSSRGATKAQESADLLRADLLNQFTPGEKVPSERTLAERLKVSRNTVRRTLALLASEGWLEPDEGGGYMVASFGQRSLNTTGLLFPFDQDILLTSPFYREVGLGISQTACEIKRNLLHFYSSGRRLTEVKPALLWSPQMRAVDSLITLDIFDSDLLTRAARLYPVVCLDAQFRLPQVSTIEFDNRTAVRMAFKYLLDLGHRRIGFFGRTNSPDPSINERYEAYCQAFEWVNLPRDPDWVFDVRTVEQVKRSPGKWLSADPEQRPTAMVVIDRFWQFTPTWLAAGIQTPRDISVVNVGVVELWSDYLQFAWRSFAEDFRTVMAQDVVPPFANHPPELMAISPTTVYLPARAMGRWGMAEVARRLNDPQAEACNHVLPSELIVGNTTAPLGETRGG